MMKEKKQSDHTSKDTAKYFREISVVIEEEWFDDEFNLYCNLSDASDKTCKNWSLKNNSL